MRGLPKKETTKLWIVTELFPPEESSTAYILGEIANHMAQKYQVGVICGPEIYDKERRIDDKNSFELEKNIQVTRVKGVGTNKNSLLGKMLRFLFVGHRLCKTLEKNVQEGDKVLLVTNPPTMIPIVSNLKKNKAFELNILVHDIFPDNLKPAGLVLPQVAYHMLNRLFEKAYARADRLIAIGHDMKKVLKQKINSFKHYPEIIVIPNWADLNMVEMQTTKGHDEYITLQYAGNIGRVQGLKQMLKNVEVASNKNLEFHLWGTGAKINEVKKYAAKHKMRNVVFHEPFLRSQQSSVLSQCDMALVCLAKGMYGLGVPSKIYNIMAAGKPVLYIGDPDSEIGVLVRNKKIGYVFSPSDTSGITKFLKSLSPERITELKEMGRRARKTAENEYTKKSILNKFSETI